MSTLLVSLLLAAGYDAYVVSGYAGQTTCNADLSYDDCPLQTIPDSTAPAAEPKCTKYRPRPAKDLRSRYEMRMEARDQEEIQKKHELKLAEEMAERAVRLHSLK